MPLDVEAKGLTVVDHKIRVGCTALLKSNDPPSADGYLDVKRSQETLRLNRVGGAT